MSATDGEPVVLTVVGPTASGKSELGLRLAEALGGEVVGADASQLYRGMDIGTAKLPVEERRGIPHHQVDVLDVTDEASVAAYQRYARADIEAIHDRGATPILVGGSGLYVRAALDRLDIPPTDPQVRARIEAEAAERGVEGTYAALAARDPAAAAAIEPRNLRRIVRALEVIELTGQPFSASMPTREHLWPTLMLGLRPQRTTLDARIDARVVSMWERGLVEEVRGLLEVGLRHGRTASRALGYAQAIAQLDGELTEHQAVTDTQAGTRRYARRQESWLRADPRIAWVDPADGAALDDLVAATVTRMRRR